MGAAKAGTQGHRLWQMWLVTALVTLYGVLDEFHQYFDQLLSSALYSIMRTTHTAS